MSKIIFFRHAQASYGADNYDQLSAIGMEQSAILGQYLLTSGLQLDKVFTGPLERQKHTYQIVREQYSQQNTPLPSPIVIPELREHEGTEAVRLAMPFLAETSAEVRRWLSESKAEPKKARRNSLLIFRYFMNEWAKNQVHVDGIPNWFDFRAEVKTGLQEVLKQTGKGETIGVFTSGGTISCIIAESLGLTDETKVTDLNFSIRNTSMTQFLYSNKAFNILSMNEIPHLSKNMITFI